MSVGCTAELRTAAPGDDEWQALVAGLMPHGRFVSAAWIRAWGQCYLPHQNWLPPLRYLTVRGSDGQLLAVFPFATQKHSGFSIASLGGFYWPFRSPVIPENSSAEAVAVLASAFTANRSISALRYGPMPETHAAIDRLNRALQRQGWRIRRVDLGETYSVDLPGTWQQFEDRLSKKLRVDTSYDERKMRRDGDLDIRCTRNTAGVSWSETVSDLGAIEGKSWQWREGGKLRFVGDRNHAFWASLLSSSGVTIKVSVWIMYFKSNPVSFCLCLDCGDVRHIIANNYAEEVRCYGTGSILYKYVFRDAIESGFIRQVSIGLGDPGYKSRWGAQPSYKLVDWIAFQPGPRGRLLEIAYRLRVHRAPASSMRRPRALIIQPVPSRHQGWVATKDALIAAKLFCCLIAAMAPPRHWPTAARLLARAHLRMQERSVRVLAHSTPFRGQDVRACTGESFAWDYLANIQAIRDILPGGWRCEPTVTGRDVLESALHRSRGAVLWFTPFAGAFLALGKALAEYSLTQLSTPSHPFSPTWVGTRLLNPIRLRAENRYLARRVRVVYGNARPAIDILKQVLHDNGVISIMAIGAGSRSLAFPFLGGILDLAIGAPRLAWETGAALIPVFALPDGDGDYRVELGPDLTPATVLPMEQALQSMTSRYVQLLEAMVRSYPTRWQGWFYPGTWRPATT